MQRFSVAFDYYKGLTCWDQPGHNAMLCLVYDRDLRFKTRKLYIRVVI